MRRLDPDKPQRYTRLTAAKDALRDLFYLKAIGRYYVVKPTGDYCGEVFFSRAEAIAAAQAEAAYEKPLRDRPPTAPAEGDFPSIPAGLPPFEVVEVRRGDRKQRVWLEPGSEAEADRRAAWEARWESFPPEWAEPQQRSRETPSRRSRSD